MDLKLSIDLKLYRVGDTEGKAVLIYGVPPGLEKKLKDLLPPGQYQLIPDYEAIKGSGRITVIVVPGQTSTNSATYQSVASWVVGSKKGILRSIGFANDTPATGQWRLTIKGQAIFTDKKQQNPVGLDIDNLELKEGDEVEILGKSDGATTVIFDGLIEGEEIG